MRQTFLSTKHASMVLRRCCAASWSRRNYIAGSQLRGPMPSLHRTKLVRFDPLTTDSLKEARGEYRRSAMTRFITDENIEPWALHVMRYKRLDFMDADAARIRHIDDRAVFRKAWQLKRFLITHDMDFLDDRLFPFSICPGLLVLPTYGRVSLEFGNLVSAATAMVNRGREMWFHTKIVARRGKSVQTTGTTSTLCRADCARLAVSLTRSSRATSA